MFGVCSLYSGAHGYTFRCMSNVGSTSRDSQKGRSLAFTTTAGRSGYLYQYVCSLRLFVNATLIVESE